MARRGLTTGLLALGALAAFEAAAVVRLVRREDPGGRHDHAATVGAGPGPPLRLVLLGDSAVDGHGLQLGESLPYQLALRVAARAGRPVQVRSLAVSGATTPDVAEFQLPRLLAAGEVDAVMVGVGVNDALRRVPSAAVAEATDAVVRAVRATAPGASLAYVPCHDLARAPGLGPVLRRVVGWRCRTVARCQLGVLDGLGVPVAVAAGPARAEDFGEDGLHPGARGVEAIAASVADALETREGRAAR